MVNPGKAKGGSLMIVFLTMVSDIHRHSVAALPFDPRILHKVRKFRFSSVFRRFAKNGPHQPAESAFLSQLNKTCDESLAVLVMLSCRTQE